MDPLTSIMVNVFTISSFFIVLREVLEACLVVGIVLAYLKKTGATHMNKWVWIGTVCGILVSLVAGIAFGVVYYVREDQLFAGKSEKIFEGIAFNVAAILLTWAIIWFMVMGRNLQAQLEKKVDRAIEADSSAKGKVVLFSIVFIQVLREGIETFIFLFGASASGESDDGIDRDAWKGVILPGFLGLIVGLVTAYVVFRGMVTLDIQKFFFWSSVILIAFAAGLVSHGMHELQEADWFGPWDERDGVEIGSAERDWWNARMWSTKECCNDKTNEFFAMLRALFGYQDTPTFVEWGSYFAYWALILSVFLVINWSAVRSARNKTAKNARSVSAFLLPSFFVGFLYACINATWTGILTTLVGLILSVLSTLVAFDVLSTWVKALKPVRRTLALAIAVCAGLFTLFVAILHIVQMNCLERSCRLPEFYYWGLIFEAEWNKRGNLGNSYVSVAVLAVSFVFSFFLFAFWAITFYLFSSHVSNDGEYVYSDRVKVAKDEETLGGDISSGERSSDIEIQETPAL